ncbi:hypothetical protein H5410_004534, partial [Solanum commersonii]
NFVGNLAVISETREEASFEVRFESFLRLTCRVFRKDRRGILLVLKFWGIILVSGEVFETARGEKIPDRVSRSTAWWASCRLWLSLVRLSMFRHLFIDLLEYGGFGCRAC